MPNHSIRARAAFPEDEVLSASEMRELLAEHGVLPLPLEHDGPLLYIFDDTFDTSDFKGLDIYLKPNLARVDNPSHVRAGMVVSQGQVDYYAVRGTNREIVRVKVSDHSTPRGTRSFAVERKWLFMPAEALFPKGPPPKQ